VDRAAGTQALDGNDLLHAQGSTTFGLSPGRDQAGDVTLRRADAKRAVSTMAVYLNAARARRFPPAHQSIDPRTGLPRLVRGE
ncbi:MAG: hypothetical protein AB7V13_11685, partial [Pseudorhodoplanes sp.]